MTENQKNKETQEFLDSMEDYNPAIPDQIISYYLQQSGFKTTDKRVLRLVSLSAHKFLAEICKESHGFCARRTAKQQGKEPRYVLATEDLYHSLKDYGINIQKPEYYSDSLANELVQNRPSSSSSSMMSTMAPSSTPQNGSNPTNE